MSIPEVQQFRTLLAEKAQAKEKVMAALGAAKLAELQGRDPDPFWATVVSEGINGTEGEKYAALRALADKVAVDHAELFGVLEGKSHDECVTVVDAFRAAGLEDDVILVSMYIMAHWEPQNIGGKVEALVRIPRGGK